MAAEPGAMRDLSPRGTKRPSDSPQPWPQSRKVPMKSYGRAVDSASSGVDATQKRSQREQVRFNQLQEDEKSRQWVAQEDEFVLKQMKKKAAIRVKDDRARPIDWVVMTLQMTNTTTSSLDEELDDDTETQVVDPNTILDRLSHHQMLELEADIDQFLRLETSVHNKDYWRSMKTICLDRRKKAIENPGDRAVSSVASDIDRLLGPKSYQDLQVLEHQINQKLESNEPIDADYWERLHENLLVWKAKAKLRKIYQSILESRQAASDHQLDHVVRDQVQEVALAREPQNNPQTPLKATEPLSRNQNTRIGDGKPAGQSADAANPVSRFAQTPNEDFSQATRSLYEKEVARGIAENEEIFAGEEDVETKSKPLWSGKYRPRKPRYFNRVQTGYEWNKYNQTHYDHDNPPPKVVQGYKFNVFYPDLIDHTQAPTYKIERQGGRKRGQSFAPAGEEDTCLIRFMSGPPYEDIAFHIVDKEWDYSAKRERGFRSSFDKGILQLHFQFKKVFYRK